MSAWLRQHGDDVVLALHVQPGAKRTAVAGLHGEALKIRLAAPPVDGKANACLIEFIAETLGVAKSRVSLVAGQTSRTKKIAVAGMDPGTAQQRLLGEAVYLGKPD
ncbi:DUF167 domain-containing protein [Denitratisoma oestradiolicum]|uniref:UPF0235 protein DENOEST_0249 n=1 Tax=Denitratisoma oestradiolicum TaxID=311182 RepID=A0A6S6XNB4_9PROT|nr:DUF167 domain-containing protein [Denitratisoma oestradiolicum]TWO80833.1 YggU family protein [Denitratisoma oestradiolicum]CAB1367421.1 conserved protein of unknown function [Denitratisoma oestradiolicum]